MARVKCPDCGMPTIEEAQHLHFDDMLCERCHQRRENPAWPTIMPAQRNFMSDPFLYKVVEVSTVHLRPEDRGRLAEADNGLCVYEYEYGWFVHTGGGGYDEYEWAAIQKHGFSEQFVRILKEAAKLGCKFVAYDGDAFVYDDLEQYDWSKA